MKVLHSICQKEEQEIQEMHKRQRELHLVPTPVCYLSLEVLDGGGEEIAEYRDRSKSWVRNWYNFIAHQTMQLTAGSLGATFGNGTVALKHISGVTISANMMYLNGINTGQGHRGGGGSAAVGVIVGAGTAAESFNGHALGSVIPHGTGSGQLSYGDMSLLTAVWDNVAKKLVQNLERSFLNFSGAAITVNEVGLYQYNTTGNTFMTARDLLVTPVSVPHDGLLKVKYTQEITFPE